MEKTQPAKKQETEIKKKLKIEESSEVKKPTEEKKETTAETKPEEKKENKKKVKTEKKDVAIANGFSLRISPKQSKYICRILVGKSPENAVKRLEEVISERRAVPMAGLEVGHKKGRGLAGGKFPKNACKIIIEIIKQAKANAIINGMENPVIKIAKSNQASAPYRRAGRKAKRTHIYIELRENAPPEKSKTDGDKK